jgi:hypothetical protein
VVPPVESAHRMNYVAESSVVLISTSASAGRGVTGCATNL